MTVTVDDSNVNIIDGADSTTGWTGSAIALTTTFQREDTGNLGDQASEGFEDPYFTFTSADFSGRTIFCWMRSGNPDTEANDGFGIILGDGTVRTSYSVGGSDNYGHFALGWSSFRLDLASLPTGFRDLVSTAPPTLTTIVDIGVSMSYITKAAGNADNVFWDQMTWVANGNPMLLIQGGTTGARGTFAEIVVLDIATTSGDAYGCIRELVGAKAYELFFGIEYGHATADTFFDDDGFQLFINGNGSGDGGMTAGNMDIDLNGGSGTNLIVWDNFVVVGVGTVSNWDWSDATYETISLTNGVLTDLGTIAFAVSGGTLRQAINLKFVNCGQIDPSTMPFNNVEFIGSTDADGAMLWPSSVTNQDTLNFVSDGSGHAIEALNTGTFDYEAITDTGYTGTRGSNLVAASGSTDAMFYNNSGGLITLNVTGGGQSPSVRNGAGATTQVNADVVVTFDQMLDDTEVRVYTAGTSTELAGIENATAGSADNRNFAATIPASTSVDYVIHNVARGENIRVEGFTWPTADQTIVVQQRQERNYDNPV